MTDRTTKLLTLGCLCLRSLLSQIRPSSFNSFNLCTFPICLCLVSTSLAAELPGTNDATNAPDRLPPTIVVAQKQPAEAQRLPVSVTAVTAETLRDADI